jgi:hypothetical protein
VKYAPADRQLKSQVTEAVAKALADTQYFGPINGLISVEAHRVDDLNVQLRIRADHGPGRGQKYHYYTVRVSEPL